MRPPFATVGEERWKIDGARDVWAYPSSLFTSSRIMDVREEYLTSP